MLPGKKHNILLSFIHSFELIIAIIVSCAFFPNHNDLRLIDYGKIVGLFFSGRQFCEANGSNLSHFLVSKNFICSQDDFRIHIISYLETNILCSQFHFPSPTYRIQVWELKIRSFFHKVLFFLTPLGQSITEFFVISLRDTWKRKLQFSNKLHVSLRNLY